jgi:hypothetical protein
VSNAHEARVAVVTGGSGGIGREIVQRLADDGFAVAVHYSGSADRAAEVVAAVTEANGSAFAVQADVADEDAVSEMFDEVTNRYGGVDVVVNTAGIMILSPLAETSLDTFDRTMRTNVRGTYVISQWAAQISAEDLASGQKCSFDLDVFQAIERAGERIFLENDHIRYLSCLERSVTIFVPSQCVPALRRHAQRFFTRKLTRTERALGVFVPACYCFPCGPQHGIRNAVC